MTTAQSSIFTRIINREIPADIVYEDDTVIAFLTIEPINLGHTLVVPKVPFVNLLDGDEVILGQMTTVAKRIGNALIAAALADGINLTMNNGETAGQEVFHAHMHVIPRLAGDQVFTPPTHATYTEGQSAAIAHTLATTLA